MTQIAVTTNGHRAGYSDPEQPILTFWIETFLQAKGVKTPATVAFYRMALQQYQRHVGPHHWPPTESSINGFLAAVKARGRAEATVHAYYRGLRTWLNWLHRRGRIAHNPIRLVEEPPNPELVPRAPRRSDLRRFFELLARSAESGGWRDVRDYTLFSLAIDSGIRVGELSKLTLTDYDPETHVVRPAAGKNHKQRTITLSDELVERLGRWLDLRERLKLPLEVQAMFVSHYRGRWRRLTHWGVRLALKRRLTQARLPHFRVHDLRHAFAIYSLRKGADLADLQKQLGHAHISTTARYLKSDDIGRRGRHNATSPLSDFG